MGHQHGFFTLLKCDKPMRLPQTVKSVDSNRTDRRTTNDVQIRVRQVV